MRSKGIALLAAVFFIVLVKTAGANSGDIESLCQFLSGDYTVIGKDLNGEKTYRGKMKLTAKDDHLTVLRIIRGKKIQGIAKIEKALGPDAGKVLRVRFHHEGKDYEATYLWHSDLDNYPRLSGYVYEKGKTTSDPGLEALFIEHNKM